MLTERQYLTPIFKDFESNLEITWTNLKVELLSEVDDSKVYKCLGIGNNEREYTAKAHFINDTFGWIEDITIIPH